MSPIISPYLRFGTTGSLGTLPSVTFGPPASPLLRPTCEPVGFQVDTLMILADASAKVLALQPVLTEAQARTTSCDPF